MYNEIVLNAAVAHEEAVPDAGRMYAPGIGAEGSPMFGEIYEQSHDRIFRLAFRITRNRQDAEDVVQECFMRVFANLDSFSGKSKLSTWVWRIAFNTALMKVRRRRRSEFSLDHREETTWGVRAVEIECHRPTPDEQYLQRELAQITAEGLAQLSPSLSGVVKLRYFKELTAGECANVLGISLSNAKSRILRARLKLRLVFTKRFRRPTAPSSLHRYPTCSFPSLGRDAAPSIYSAARPIEKRRNL